jgi:hypothetical protein
MKNQYSLKKQLNNTLYKKNLESNTFGLAIENVTESTLHSNKIKFTKALLQNKTLVNILKTTNLNFPSTFFFFNSFENYKIFFKKHFFFINILKIKHKILKTYFLHSNFFSQNQINFFFFFN